MTVFRFGNILVTTAILSWAAAGSAQAALVISSKPTNNVSCSAGVCTATAKSAVMNVAELTTMLGAGDVTLVSGSKAKDIEVKSAFSWASASRLTLDAYQSIAFDRSMTVAGSGAVTLTTNDGGSGGMLSFGTDGRIHFWDLSSSLVIDGASYTLVADIATLASDIAANPAGRYALAKNYDASVDGTYTHAPVLTPLTGTVEGLGNSIANLNIYGKGSKIQVGLFGSIAASGSVNDLRLLSFYGKYGKQDTTGGLTASNAGTLKGDFVSGTIQQNNTSANTGMLAGVNLGTIRYCQTEGGITQPNSAANSIGGLVGYNESSIDHSSSSVSIHAVGYYLIGGLVGRSGGGTISNSSASGALSNGPYNDTVGGLLGTTCCGAPTSIVSSHATGAVGGSLAGGLVGNLSHAGDTIVNSYASGIVVAFSGGGLVGWQGFGTSIAGSHATGNVSDPSYGGSSFGGLVGLGRGNITTSYATGNVSFHYASGGNAGGLVGVNNGGIDRSFATGSVTGDYDSIIQYEGGLVGQSDGQQAAVTNSYATGDGSFIGESYEIGAVSGIFQVGGFLGANVNSTGQASNDYWDTTTSGAASGVGHGNADGITGLTSAELQSGLPAGFDPSIWAESPSINNGFPYLIANPPP
jgi:hypothetical protein